MYGPPVTYDTRILQNWQCIALRCIRDFAFCIKSVLGLYSIVMGNSQSFIVFFMAVVKTEMLWFLK